MNVRTASLFTLSGGVLLSMFSLTGCMVGPKYKVPSAPAPPAYKEASPDAYKETADWHVATPADAAVRGAWWTIFNDDELNILEPQVDTANQTLKAADANLRAARANIRVQNADRYPTLGTSPTALGMRESSNQPYPFNSSEQTNGSANLILPLQVSYEVDLCNPKSPLTTSSCALPMPSRSCSTILSCSTRRLSALRAIASMVASPRSLT